MKNTHQCLIDTFLKIGKIILFLNFSVNYKKIFLKHFFLNSLLQIFQRTEKKELILLFFYFYFYKFKVLLGKFSNDIFFLKIETKI